MFPPKLRLADRIASGDQGTYQRHLSRHSENTGAHSHDFFEMFWVEKGPGVHNLHGEEQIAPVGTLQLIRPEDVHTLYALPGQDFEWTNIAVFPASWTALRRRYFGAGYFGEKDPAKRRFSLPPDHLASLRRDASELARGARHRLAFERFLLNAIALLPGDETAASVPPPWLEELDQELRQQANFSRGVTAVVKKAGRCAEHVCRAYRKHYGQTPTQAMTAARMDYAASLLAQSEIKIIDLALEAGLENLGYFYRIFQQRFHCTPREYRLRKRLPVRSRS